MHNLRRFYYQNKEKIWKVILIISFLLGIIYYINSLLDKEMVVDNKSAKNEISIYDNEPNKTYISEESAIYGSTVTEMEVEKINSVISKFLQYCKNGNVEDAYEMLSNDCKENEYTTLQKFKDKYLNVKFSKYDTFEIQKLINNTYKITISKDILETGDLKVNNNIEYITMVNQDSVEKLNINGYIGKEDINKENTINKIKIAALSKKVYMDYEEYNFKIENLSNKTIKLNTLSKSGTMHLKSLSQTTFNAHANELYDEDVEIKSQHESNINIKYAKPYLNDAKIDKIVFSNIILDYPRYKRLEDKDTFEDMCQIEINL